MDINLILGVKDNYDAPRAMMMKLLNPKKRNTMFNNLLKLFDYKVDYDWFQKYFEDEHAERKSKGQDFSPMEIGELLSKLIGNSDSGSTTYDVGAGTGTLIIARWNDERMCHLPWDYKPSNYLYISEELSGRAIPFLITNMAIRGMNAVVLHGDTLQREFSQIFFIQNSDDNPLGFSEINVMPRNKQVEKCFDVQSWVDEPITHIESPIVPQYLAGSVYETLVSKDSQGGCNGSCNI